MKETISIRQPFGRALLLAALAGILGTAVWTWEGSRPGRGGADRPLEGLRIFGTVPDFSLIQRDGRQVTLADLRGKVWIANFIYTHCTETCPLQSAQMARLQEELKAEPEVRLVSITVDPEQDTPEVLSEYAGRYSADRDRWLFLTGEKKALYTLAREGFRLGVADPEEAGDGSAKQERPDRPTSQLLQNTVATILEPLSAEAHPGHPGKPFLHSSRFVLVDRQARIRGYYPGTDEEALGRLRRDIRALLREADQ